MKSKLISSKAQKDLYVIVRNRKVVLPQSGNIDIDGLFDVGQSRLLALTLADAAGKAGHLCHVVAVFSWIDHDLSHVL